MGNSGGRTGRAAFLLALVIAGTWLLPGCLPYIRKKAAGDAIRVAVLAGVDSALISGVQNGVFRERFRVDAPACANGVLHFKPRDGSVSINDRKYRGAAEVRSFGERIWIINVLPIEDYLKGVVPCEIGAINARLFEAGKAQAVAARTYAYGHLGRHDDMGFDVYATIRDQVYNGMAAEDDLISDAVDKTRSVVITCRGEPIDAKYHSTCGGMTADFSDAWSGKGPPYLTGVTCGFCGNSPHFDWRRTSANRDFFTQLRSRLARAGIAIGDTESVNNIILYRNRKTRRVVKAAIVTARRKLEVGVNSIRTVFGTETDPGGLLKSTLFNLGAAAGDSIAISGKGWGHGVGMCQYGALEMARQGKNFIQILRHYYPGTKIGRW